ncbi:DUF6519 domain-containing protein [Primorskyibacter sp. 2E233]|uniref:DUF6519 domain-containing protein n=1 Tax=Primorskyibacter sp. 2E233 TaxID=3413431 RepID=UPI003BF010C5
MSGDYSKNSFDGKSDFSLVRMQQGRLFTDADWNEQGDILRSAERASAADLIGHAGFPQDHPGFGLTPDNTIGALIIGAGTGYVEGVRHENAAPKPLMIKKHSGNGAARKWTFAGPEVLSDGAVVSLSAEGEAPFSRLGSFAEEGDGTLTFKADPALPDNTTEVFAQVTFERQPYAPKWKQPAANDTYFAFLKSTEMPCTALDEPSLREVAFDGPDTATRDRTIWQVQLYRRSLLNSRGLTDDALTCTAMAGGIDPVLGRRAPGKLRARAEVSAQDAGPCRLPPAAGYRSLLNLLYRVEIHNGAAQRFKWSRENAIHRFRYGSIDGTVLIFENTGRDEQSALAAENWIEIRDQDMILAEEPGFFAHVSEVQGGRVTLDQVLDPVTLDPLTNGGAPDIDALPRAAIATRWEGGIPQKIDPDVWQDLDNGVQVNFAKGRFQEGDYWTIPARSVTGDVEWPVHEDSNEPALQPPEGPRRDYAALARLTKSNAGWTLAEDCRPIFPSAVNALKFNYVGGDGQEAMPDPLSPATRVALPSNLTVSATRGHAPVEGELIRFAITAGDGRFQNGQKTMEVRTNAQGLAGVSWSLDAGTFRQVVTAHRINAAGAATHAPIFFTATLSTADHTSFDPGSINALAGANTVQEAIERLAGLQQIGCSTHFITPGPGWEKVLENLKPGSNASICFTPGNYSLARPVKMTGLGQLTLHSGGPGIANIMIDRSESALEFIQCKSVTVHGLTVSTPAANTAAAVKKNRHGTLDFQQCETVTVEGCTLSCGGGTSTQRSCLRVQGRAVGSQAARSVSIRGNTLTVGNMQEAILVTDAIDVDIADNQIRAKPGGSSKLPIDAFLGDRKWVVKTVQSLVARPVLGKIQVDSPDKMIRSGQWRVGFTSPLPQDLWDEAVAKTPPSKVQMRSLATFDRYAQERIKEVVENAEQFEAFKRSFAKLRESLGGNADLLKDPKVRRSLIVTSEPRAYRFDDGGRDKRNTVLEANGQLIAFDSPFSQRDWNTALARSQLATKVVNSQELLAVTMQLAERLLTDEAARAPFGSVKAWLDRFRVNRVNMAFQGIICGGRRLDNVAIHGNVIRDCQIGARVATSGDDDKTYSARSIQIERNRMELMAQSAEAYAGFGLLVGNALSVRILDNDMALSSRPNYTKYFSQGIRIWGFIGEQINVSRNRIAMATMGLRLNHSAPETEPKGVWIFAENIINGPKGTVAHKVTPSQNLKARENGLFLR